MRRLFNVIVRGVVAVAVVMSLSMPVQARPIDDGWFEAKRERVLKFLKTLVIRSFGDGLSDPKP